jgi:hypothetical protein
MEGTFKTNLTDAIRYWEPRPVTYNAVLIIVTAIYFAKGYPVSRSTLTIETALLLFVLAVGANIVYCAAYLPDLLAQASGFRELWKKYRWLLFASASPSPLSWPAGLRWVCSR